MGLSVSFFLFFIYSFHHFCKSLIHLCNFFIVLTTMVEINQSMNWSINQWWDFLQWSDVSDSKSSHILLQLFCFFGPVSLIEVFSQSLTAFEMKTKQNKSGSITFHNRHGKQEHLLENCCRWTHLSGLKVRSENGRLEGTSSSHKKKEKL